MLDQARILLGDDSIDTQHILEKAGKGLVPEIYLRGLEPAFLGQVDIPVCLLVHIPFGGEHLHGAIDTRLGHTQAQGNIGCPYLFMFLTESQYSL